MTITDYRQQILSFVKTVSANKDRVYGNLDYVGGIDIGNDRKAKCQYVKGKIAVPYEALRDEDKMNIAIVQYTIVPVIGIPCRYVSDKSKEMKENEEKKFDEYLKKHPRIAEALTNLIQSLEREDEEA